MFIHKFTIATHSVIADQSVSTKVHPLNEQHGHTFHQKSSGQPNCNGSNVAYNKFMDIMRVMIAVAFKQIYCAFINLVFIKARYIIAQITFLQNFYYHLIFRNDFHDCLFIFVSLTPHCQSTYSSPLKPEHPNKCKEFPTPFILYKWQREPNAGVYSNDWATKLPSHILHHFSNR